MASAQPPLQPTAVRTTKLTSTVSTSSNVLIERFTDILEIAAPNNKDKYITAAETYQIDVHASAMVGLISCLLLIPIGTSGRGSTSGDTEIETIMDFV